MKAHARHHRPRTLLGTTEQTSTTQGRCPTQDMFARASGAKQKEGTHQGRRTCRGAQQSGWKTRLRLSHARPRARQRVQLQNGRQDGRRRHPLCTMPWLLLAHQPLLVTSDKSAIMRPLRRHQTVRPMHAQARPRWRANFRRRATRVRGVDSSLSLSAPISSCVTWLDRPIEVLAETLEAVDVENACRALDVHVREEGAPLPGQARIHRSIQPGTIERLCSATNEMCASRPRRPANTPALWLARRMALHLEAGWGPRKTSMEHSRARHPPIYYHFGRSFLHAESALQ